MIYYVYILESLKDRKLYIGYSKNPTQRLREHNLGKTKSLYKRRPLILIYKEKFDNKLNTLRREKFLKSGQGRKYLKEMLRFARGGRKIL